MLQKELIKLCLSVIAVIPKWHNLVAIATNRKTKRNWDIINPVIRNMKNAREHEMYLIPVSLPASSLFSKQNAMFTLRYARNKTHMCIKRSRSCDLGISPMLCCSTEADASVEQHSIGDKTLLKMNLYSIYE